MENMYVIKNARVASERERANILKVMIGSGNYKKQFSYDYCIKNESFIKGAYTKFYDDYRQKKYNEYKTQIVEGNRKRVQYESDREDQYQKNVIIWNDWLKELKENPINNYCKCGGSLRYIASHNFIGCSNYKDFTSDHINFNKPSFIRNELTILPIESFESFDTSFEYSKMYLHYFKKDYNLPDNLMQSILYEFIHGIWKLPKITNELTSDFYLTGEKVNKRSKKEEQIIYNVLKSKFDTVMDQPMIIYDIQGDYKTKCFPDFICSNNDVILVIDVKKNPSQVDDNRLIKYDELVNFICNTANIKKKVITKYYFYDIDGFSSDTLINGITLDQISSL
jgi:hypothetical protein